MSGCFHCRNHTDARRHPSGVGWAYSCKHGLDTERIANSPEGVLACEKGDVQFGFQIGGYYRHMWLKGHPANAANACLEWYIEGDAEYPHHGTTEFHLCEWTQLEEWVAFWGKELRRRGWVVDEPEEEEPK